MNNSLTQIQNSFESGALSFYFRKIIEFDTVEKQYTCIKRVKGLYFIPEEQEIGIFYNQYDSISYSYTKNKLFVHHDKSGLYDNEEDSIQELINNWVTTETNVYTAIRHAYETLTMEDSNNFSSEIEINTCDSSTVDNHNLTNSSEYKADPLFEESDQDIEVQEKSTKNNNGKKNNWQAYYTQQEQYNQRQEIERQQFINNAKHVLDAALINTVSHIHVPNASTSIGNTDSGYQQMPYPYNNQSISNQMNNFGTNYEYYNPTPNVQAAARTPEPTPSLNIDYKKYTEEATAYRTPVYINTSDTPLERSMNNATSGCIDSKGHLYEGMSLVPPKRDESILFDSNKESSVRQTNNHYCNYDASNPIDKSTFFSPSKVDKMLPPNGQIDKCAYLSEGPLTVDKQNKEQRERHLLNDSLQSQQPDADEIQSKYDDEKEVLRKFNKTIDILNYFEKAGRTIVDGVTNIATDQENAAYMGNQEVKKYTDIGASMLGVIGANAELKKQVTIATKIEETTVKATELIASKDIPLKMEDFKDKKVLKDKLNELDISDKDKKMLVKYRDAIHTKINARDTLLKAASENANLFTEKELAILKSSDFFNSKNHKDIDNIIGKYFGNSKNEAARKIGITNLSDKNFKKLLKSTKKLSFTSEDEKLLGILKENRKAKKIERQRKKSKGERRGAITQRVISGSGLKEDSSYEGVKNIKKIYKGGKIVYSLAKYSLLKSYNTKISKKIRAIARSKYLKVKSTLKYTIPTKIKKTRAYKTVRKKLQPVTVAKKSAKKTGKKAKEKAKTVKKRTRKVVQKTTKPFSIITSPIRFLSSGIFKIVSLKSAIQKAAVIVVAGFALLYALITLIVASLMAIGEGIAQTKDIIQAEEKTIKEIDEYIKTLEENKYEEATAIGQGTPINDKAADGKKLYHYGSPTTKGEACIWHNNKSGETYSGYNIYYVDAKGKPIASKTSNSRDIISMFTVMINNAYPESDNIKKDAPWVFDILDALYAQLNPSISSKESDLYFCTYGCDDFTYSCNNLSDYEAYENMQKAGVKFYWSMLNYSEGCSIKYCTKLTKCTNKIVDRYECGGHKDKENCSDISTCENKKTIYKCGGHHYCDGHTLKCCHGHRDAEIYITLLTKEDIFTAGQNGNLLTYYDYATNTTKSKPLEYDTTSYKEWTQDFFSDNAWASPDAIEGCKNIYNQDWYSLYGFIP